MEESQWRKSKNFDQCYLKITNAVQASKRVGPMKKKKRDSVSPRDLPNAKRAALGNITNVCFTMTQRQ